MLIQFRIIKVEANMPDETKEMADDIQKTFEQFNVMEGSLFLNFLPGDATVLSSILQLTKKGREEWVPLIIAKTQSYNNSN
jgi:hypothetical protein